MLQKSKLYEYLKNLHTLLTKKGVKFCLDLSLVFPYWFTEITVDVIWGEIMAAGNCRGSPEHTQIYHRALCVYTSQNTE